MKRFICIILFVMAPLSFISATQLSISSDTTTFILVRHAEKADDGTSDPQLSEEGLERAHRLVSVLKDYNITSIYSTKYNRTQQTAAPIAESLNLEVMEYDLSDPNHLLQQIIDSSPNKTVLIFGHSNTTPIFVNMLLGQKKYEWFEEDDFSNIFIVKATEVGKGTEEHFTY